MKFAEAERELIHHEDAAMALRMGLRRVWLIRAEVPGLHTSTETRHYVPGVCAELRITRGARVGHARVLLAVTDVRGVDSGATYAFLSATEMRTLADLREVVDRWVAGEIDELPRAVGAARDMDEYIEESCRR